MSITGNQPPDKFDAGSIDNEHQVQIGLLNALHDAVKVEKPAAEINEILNQLTAYSELHFMSEELLMRLYAYPDYDDHVHDHEAMTEYLNKIMKTINAGQDSMVMKTANDMREFLLAHISTRDESLTEYLTKMQA